MEWTVIASASGAVIAVGAIITFLVRHVLPFFRNLATFWHSLVGAPANPKAGRPHDEPGLFERLTAQDEMLATIKHELFTNGGGSLRDDLVSQGEDVAKLHQRMGRLERQIRQIKKGKTS